MLPDQRRAAGTRPPDADLEALKALVAPIVDKVSEIRRVEGGRVD